MKNNRQYSDSMTNLIIGFIGITLTIIMVIVLDKTPKPTQNQPKIEDCDLDKFRSYDTTTIQQIKTKDDKDWSGTRQDDDNIYYPDENIIWE